MEFSEFVPPEAHGSSRVDSSISPVSMEEARNGTPRLLPGRHACLRGVGEGGTNSLPFYSRTKPKVREARRSV